MNTGDAHTALWLASSLFWLGVLLVPLGLFLLLMPRKALRMADILNRWISTTAFFDSLNKPRYQERLFYRHHRVLGVSIILLVSFSLYMLVFYAGLEQTLAYFQQLAVSDFETWLFTNLYYILVAVMVIMLVAGGVILFRPSVLKRLESWGNRWIATEDSLRSLDEVHELPGNMLSGSPRLFGVFVLLGAAYIIYMTAGLVF